ncbi:MAG TPA: hypothetical protein VMF61_08875 [Candidatus Acidoferrales bacterium]|nr:hypothetical protein [Candidatus Acidoferrales bacterium]
MPPTLGDVQQAVGRLRSVHLIEAQALFVPILADVFTELGLELTSVSSDIDMHKLLDDQPDVLFVDADFVNQEPLRLINALRMLVPESVICVYTGQRSPDWAKACHFAGATAVFSKNAHRREIVSGMRDALQHERFTDVRLRNGE